MENFSVILRQTLEDRGITQKFLADKAGTTEATISRYILGRNHPDAGIIIKIAQALDVSMDYLCGLTDNMTPKESLGPELQLLIRCYTRADERDKGTIWHMLERYMTSEEKDRPISSYFGVKTGSRG